MFEWDEHRAALEPPCITPSPPPRSEQLELLDSDPGSCHSRAYDMVLNGSEIGGGSIRIHQPEVQQQVFAARHRARRKPKRNSASY